MTEAVDFLLNGTYFIGPTGLIPRPYRISLNVRLSSASTRPLYEKSPYAGLGARARVRVRYSSFLFLTRNTQITHHRETVCKPMTSKKKKKRKNSKCIMAWRLSVATFVVTARTYIYCWKHLKAMCARTQRL